MGVGVIVGVNVWLGMAVAVNVKVTVGNAVFVAGATVGESGINVEVACCPDPGAQALVINKTSNIIFNFNSILQIYISLPTCPGLQERDYIFAQHFIGITSLHYNDRG